MLENYSITTSNRIHNNEKLKIKKKKEKKKKKKQNPILRVSTNLHNSQITNHQPPQVQWKPTQPVNRNQKFLTKQQNTKYPESQKAQKHTILR